MAGAPEIKGNGVKIFAEVLDVISVISGRSCVAGENQEQAACAFFSVMQFMTVAVKVWHRNHLIIYVSTSFEKFLAGKNTTCVISATGDIFMNKWVRERLLIK
ncbi:MAG: hypothetical protein GX451_01220 [Acholeplasmataceae bacterium]|nr:hypothetical protein [Acholeplasmataceae bacterium]